jgi:Raf kinase inhibitor-like YbhB/YbcL family protein
VRRPLTPAIVVVALALLSACRDDGRELRDPIFPPPPTTTTSLPPIDTAAAAPTVPPLLTLVTPWPDGAVVPVRHTCDDADIAPALTWTNVPLDAIELAVTVTDLDADGFVHWAMTGIETNRTGLAEGEVPEGARQWPNDFGVEGWGGPCPPPGDPEHFYLFTVHALNQPLIAADNSTAAEVVDMLNESAVAQASVSGLYGRTG